MAPSGHLDFLLGTPASPQKGPGALWSLIVLLPVGGKALREVTLSREGGLVKALLSTGFSGFLVPSSQAFSQPMSHTAFPLPASRATTRRRRASDSESSVCRTR